MKAVQCLQNAGAAVNVMRSVFAHSPFPASEVPSNVSPVLFPLPAGMGPGPPIVPLPNEWVEDGWFPIILSCEFLAFI